MKRHFLLLAVAAVALSVFFLLNKKEGAKMCCAASSPTDAFAGLGGSKAFQDAHPAPLPTSADHAGEMVKLDVEGGQAANGYLMKVNDGSRYLLLFHEWWGLNDYIKNEADFYAKALNVNVLCPDLYDGKLATDAETAGKLMGANDRSRSEAIIRAAYRHIGPTATAQVMGWCFGGGWSCQAAIIGGKQATACVIYYGMPEESVERLASLNCPVLGIFAEKDQWINREVVERFEKNMAAAARPLTVKWYPADHAFANPSSPRFSEAPAKEAREATLLFLKEK